MARNLVTVLSPYRSRSGITETENKEFVKTIMRMFINAGVAPIAPLTASCQFLQLSRERERFLTLKICKSLIVKSDAIAFVLRPLDLELGGFDKEMRDIWDWMQSFNETEHKLSRSSIYLCDQAGTLIDSARLDYADDKPWKQVHRK